MSLSIGAGPQYPDYMSKQNNNPQNVINTDAKIHDDVKKNTAAGVRQKKSEGVQECETCKNRKYQDGSNDGGVSFKSPTKVSPGMAASAVRSHEQEHVTRNASKAQREDREVVSSSVKIFTAICPECGRPYVSGGETSTVTAAKNDGNKNAEQNQNKNINGLDLSV